MTPLLKAALVYYLRYTFSFGPTIVMLFLMIQGFFYLPALMGLEKQAFTLFFCVVTTLLLSIHGSFFIDPPLNSGHFCHLSLCPEAFLWVMLVQLSIQGCFLGLFVAACAWPWLMLGRITPDTIVLFILAVPYLVTVQTLLVTLSQGHMQRTFIAPFLMLPLQIPVLLIILKEPHISWRVWGSLPWLLMPLNAWVLHKVLQKQPSVFVT